MIKLRVKELRKNAGLTQYQLAEKSGLDQSSISRLERGETTASIESLYAIAKALGVDAAAILRPEQQTNRLLKIVETVPQDQQEDAADMLELFLRILERQGPQGSR